MAKLNTLMARLLCAGDGGRAAAAALFRFRLGLVDVGSASCWLGKRRTRSDVVRGGGALEELRPPAADELMTTPFRAAAQHQANDEALLKFSSLYPGRHSFISEW